ncbi:MAG: L-erythro-3,5-diaminohexanoate dehydrogenase [Spirochaetota bacterium]|nr:L-erythro-3,5-diaminohexanoate dehydrogenase [Spirochaetota bacterium]
MNEEYIPNGNPFGTHRVIEPVGSLPQPAQRINNDTSVLWDNEILIDVDTLNIDSASFAQLKSEVGGDIAGIEEMILDIVNSRGKMHNPVTGSGGMLMGNVAKVGKRLKGRDDLSEGDRIASLVSLSLTPLKIDTILEIKPDTDQVRIKGRAILFESGIYSRLDGDLPDPLALAVLDVAGAPAQTGRLVKPGDTVVIIGATGKSGILCSYVARKIAGSTGRIIGIGHTDERIRVLSSLNLCDIIIKQDARDALSCYEEIMRVTEGGLADLVINSVNIPDTELSSILICRQGGKVYFFSMATSFTKAALGAEGVGKDIEMIIGNGYAENHAKTALSILTESKDIRDLFESIYV